MTNLLTAEDVAKRLQVTKQAEEDANACDPTTVGRASMYAFAAPQRRRYRALRPHLETPLTLEVDSLQLEFATQMRKAYIRDELIYAYLRTGVIVTEENYDYLTPEDRRAWDRAFEEYARHFEGEK
jgi:hypothetical protein